MTIIYIFLATESKNYNIRHQMINYLSKYRKHYSYLLLAGYLFIIALSIFHYHHINLRNGNYQVESNTDKESSIPLDKLVGLDNECIVSHFASTISFINYFPIIFYSADANQTFSFLENPSKLIYVILFRNNPLRAPPSVLPS